MILKTLNGRPKNVSITPYTIDWEGDSLSKFQEEVKDFLYDYWRYHIVCEEFPVTGTKMRFDFINFSKKIVVEANGTQHNDPDAYHNFGSKAIYLNQLKKDMKKYNWCQINGFTFVEIEPQDMPLTKEFFEEKYNILL